MILRKGEVRPGLYHYNVKKHALETLLEGNFNKYLNYLYKQDIAKGVSMLIVVTSIPIRTAIKYPTQWQRFILLEAGHLGQNVYLVSEAMDIGCCAIGGWDDTSINKLLDIDGKYESIAHLIAVGKIN